VFYSVVDDADGNSAGAGKMINKVFLFSNQVVRALLDASWMEKYTIEAHRFLS